MSKESVTFNGSVTPGGLLAVMIVFFIPIFVLFIISFLVNIAFNEIIPGTTIIYISLILYLLLILLYVISALTTKYTFREDSIDVESFNFLFFGKRKVVNDYSKISNVRFQSPNEMILDLKGDKDITIFSKHVSKYRHAIIDMISNSVTGGISIIDKSNSSFSRGLIEFYQELGLGESTSVSITPSSIGKYRVTDENSNDIALINVPLASFKNITVQKGDNILFSIEGSKNRTTGQFDIELLDKNATVVAKIIGSLSSTVTKFSLQEFEILSKNVRLTHSFENDQHSDNSVIKKYLKSIESVESKKVVARQQVPNALMITLVSLLYLKDFSSIQDE